MRIGSNLNQIAHALNAAARGGVSVELGQVLAAVRRSRQPRPQTQQRPRR